MYEQGEWIANCKPERVDRIASASVYELCVGPPKANQLQNQDDLEQMGIVGLYRMGEKDAKEVQQGQEKYLANCNFAPTAEMLASFLGPAANTRGRPV